MRWGPNITNLDVRNSGISYEFMIVDNSYFHL